MNETFIPKSNYSTKTWYILDANQKPVGRIATIISSILQGKHKVDYHPAVDNGDYVIVVNAGTMFIDSWDIGHVKFHAYCPGRPGSSLKKVFERLPRKIVENVVRNMLPQGLKSRISTRLKVYENSNHPHIAQKPIELNWE